MHNDTLISDKLKKIVQIANGHDNGRMALAHPWWSDLRQNTWWFSSEFAFQAQIAWPFSPQKGVAEV